MTDPRSYVLIDPKERRPFNTTSAAVKKVTLLRLVECVQLPGGCLVYRSRIPWVELLQKRARALKPSQSPETVP